MPPRDDEKFRVLVAEDDSIMSQLIEAMLRDMGIVHITRARTGRQALEECKRTQFAYSMIISDWSMPEMTGLDLLKAVRAENSEVPFLMITARAAADAVAEASKAKVTAYIAKPFSALELQKKMESILETSIESKKTFGHSHAF